MDFNVSHLLHFGTSVGIPTPRFAGFIQGDKRLSVKTQQQTQTMPGPIGWPRLGPAAAAQNCPDRSRTWLSSPEPVSSMGLTLDINNISGVVINTKVQHSLPFFVRFPCLEGTVDL